ncbi:MAG: NAD(P)-binding domain-containing protein [Nitrosopumilus sp.]|nr:NAD(P)-binding domain-containing protein [Nitrosopumilus sp.]CAI9830943.1 Glutamyl-tRNA reductase [Nitrosopumilaceae archaeon]MDA7942217.1 NAD(P)-binding domain-containing protein [Nitrosopumilus sp.]MDA7944115.1 NAD(P)-binding domain-containing protein [Nitrosopumilus sp.]MDA7945643.1 NAD(P)-binding domain-containing protein [Nitrosopumilus sp.]
MDRVSFDLMNARVTFKNVPLHALSKFAFKDVAAAAREFIKIPDVEECVIVQTASRVEVFIVGNVVTGDTPDGRRPEGKGLVLNKVKETWISLSSLEQVDIDHFDQTLEVYRGDDVYLQLLRLASGIDSFVLGKQEVFDEIVQSIAAAKEAGVSGKVTNRLFESVIRMGTRMRDTTGIANNTVSLGDVAVKLVDEKAGLDAKKKVLLIGTGEPAAMIAKTLAKMGIGFDVASRTAERAAGFAALLGGTPLAFEEALAGFDKYDIIFVATTADYFLVTYERIRLVMEEKKKGTLVLDLSDPRTVDEGITALPGIKLLFRDQVYEAYEESAREKREIVPAVEKIIEKEIVVLSAAMGRLDGH